jgi:hypothetical protein
MLAEVVATSFCIGGLIIFRAVSFQPKIIHVRNAPLNEPKLSKSFESSAQHPHPVTSAPSGRSMDCGKTNTKQHPVHFLLKKSILFLSTAVEPTNVINVPTGRSQTNHPKIGVCSDSAVTPHQTEMDVKANEGKFFK